MQFDRLKRREFITLIGGTAAWPLVARAQQSAMPVIGYLYAGSPEPTAHLLAAFRKGLSESGYVEGRVAIEFRWAHNELDRVPELAADLVRRGVSVIVAPGSIVSAAAAKAATTTIPIVFTTGTDPVQAGLVASFNRPGGNVTGITSMNLELGQKRLGMLQELLPNAARFAALVLAQSTQQSEALIQDMLAGAASLGRQIEIVRVVSARDIDEAFESISAKGSEAVVVSPGPLFNNNRVQLAILAARHGLPAIYSSREFAQAGGLMSYGPSITEEFHQGGIYCGRLLKGEKVAELPVLRASKFEFIINLQTARAFHLEVSPALLARADEVIE
jgi:putative ABC transport system substrate-binding protein